MTVARPVAAFCTAFAAGITENLFSYQAQTHAIVPDLTCPVDACCDGHNCSPTEHRQHHSFFEKLIAGIKYAFNDLWEDIAKWFLIGLLLAGLITVLIPEDILSKYLGAGLPSMLLMLAVGIPLYICATASTPIAAALILKGVSPGAALVFLLAGPATNMAALTVLTGVLGKRATAIYLATIAIAAVVFGLAVDHVYQVLGISAQAMVGQASEILPAWMQWGGAIVILLLSIKPLTNMINAYLKKRKKSAVVSRNAAVNSLESLTPPSSCGPT
jgi:uncharacterized membrane protein YraQ (UPF0718 family)